MLRMFAVATGAGVDSYQTVVSRETNVLPDATPRCRPLPKQVVFTKFDGPPRHFQTTPSGEVAIEVPKIATNIPFSKRTLFPA